jgi:uncharacterized protein YggE
MADRTITTVGTGRREARPELATVEVTAIGEGESAVAARETARDRAASVRASVTESLVSSEQIRRVGVELEESSQLFDSVDDVPFRATERLRVDCVPETADGVVVAASDAGGTVPTVRFDLHDGRRGELRLAALDAAMERARAKAERMAGAEDLAVDGVREVTSTETSTGMESIVDEALVGSHDADFHPDPIPVTESVEVVYDLATD